MTVDEIKRTYSMREIVERYGVRVNRDGMCCCPIHGEKRASMKVYKDSFHCFACGANGDVFTFIQKMDCCDFKTAFYQLGGEYEKPTVASRMALYHAQKAKEKRQREEQKRKAEIVKNNTVIHASRELFKQSEPLSDDWWYYMDIYTTAVQKDIRWEEVIK